NDVYLRHSTVHKEGKAHTYWRLVRSVRRGGKVRQETVAQLGELDAQGRAKAQALARRITGRAEQRELFEQAPGAEDEPGPGPSARAALATCGSAGGCGAPSGSTCDASSSCRRGERKFRGPRWRRSSSSRGCANRPASCTSRRTGTGARRSRTCSTCRASRS